MSKKLFSDEVSYAIEGEGRIGVDEWSTGLQLSENRIPAEQSLTE